MNLCTGVRISISLGCLPVEASNTHTHTSTQAHTRKHTGDPRVPHCLLVEAHLGHTAEASKHAPGQSLHMHTLHRSHYEHTVEASTLTRTVHTCQAPIPVIMLYDVHAGHACARHTEPQRLASRATWSTPQKLSSSHAELEPYEATR